MITGRADCQPVNWRGFFFCPGGSRPRLPEPTRRTGEQSLLRQRRCDDHMDHSRPISTNDAERRVLSFFPPPPFPFLVFPNQHNGQQCRRRRSTSIFLLPPVAERCAGSTGRESGTALFFLSYSDHATTVAVLISYMASQPLNVSVTSFPPISCTLRCLGRKIGPVLPWRFSHFFFFPSSFTASAPAPPMALPISGNRPAHSVG